MQTDTDSCLPDPDSDPSSKYSFAKSLVPVNPKPQFFDISSVHIPASPFYQRVMFIRILESNFDDPFIGLRTYSVNNHLTQFHDCLIKVEETIKALWYTSDGVPLMKSLLTRFASSLPPTHVMITYGEQCIRALERSVGDWTTTINTIVSYFDRCSGTCTIGNVVVVKTELSEVVGSYLTSTWSLLHSGNSLRHLVGAIICAFNWELSVATHTAYASMAQIQDKSIYRVYDLDLSTAPDWHITCNTQNINTNRDDFGQTVHDWKSIKTLREDHIMNAALHSIAKL